LGFDHLKLSENPEKSHLSAVDGLPKQWLRMVILLDICQHLNKVGRFLELLIIFIVTVSDGTLQVVRGFRAANLV